MLEKLGELRVLQRLNKFEFGVELWIMRSGLNRNGWNYQNIQQNYLTFVGAPILCSFPGGRIGGGHDSKEITDPKTGEKYYSFIGANYEKIVGTLSGDSEDFRLEEVDGETWIVAKGRLFTFYARELVEHIIETGVMEVSAETEVTESYMEGNVEVFTQWVGLAVTILHESVPPAIPGARIEELAAMREEFNSLCLKAASYINAEADEEEPAEEEEEEERVPVHNNEEETNDKPHPTNPKGEEKKLILMSKKQVAEIAPRFNGYTVLAGGTDENGMHFVLMAENGDTAVYTMASADETIAPEKINRVEGLASFSFGEDAKLDVYVYELTDALSATIVAANSKIEKLEADLADANATVKTMTENEESRRVQAAHACAANTLAKFNANRERKVDSDILTAINAAIDNGDFTHSVTEKGEWAGEAQVAEKVLAACAKKIAEFDAEDAAKNKSTYIWEGMASRSEDLDDVAALLSSFGM